MNTSRKGRDYEWAFRKHLEEVGALLVIRSAASKGPYDLIAVSRFKFLSGYQLKSGPLSCRRATAVASSLYGTYGIPSFVVHRTKTEPFCLH